MASDEPADVDLLECPDCGSIPAHITIEPG